MEQHDDRSRRRAYGGAQTEGTGRSRHRDPRPWPSRTDVAKPWLTRRVAVFDLSSRGWSRELLLPENEQAKLNLIDSWTVPTGVVVVRYEPSRAAA